MIDQDPFIQSVLSTIEKNQYFKDFLCYLEFIGTGQARLTQTGNLNLATLMLISKFIDPPEPMFPGEKLRSESEWLYLESIDVLASLMKLTQNRKGKKILMKRGKDYFTLNLFDKFLLVFLTYWQTLDWEFLSRYGTQGKDSPVTILQNNQPLVAGYVLNCDQWTSIWEFSETLRLELDLKIFNYLGATLPERVHNCIQMVVINILEQFDLLDIEYKTEQIGNSEYKKAEKMKITGLGKVMLGPLSTRGVEWVQKGIFSRN